MFIFTAMLSVSVVLPVFNGAAYLHNCIESILVQTFSDFELIIVNDGSTDNTLSLAEQFAHQDLRIHILNISHAGVAKAFNTGLQAAHGKYIARMDVDDLMFASRLEKQIRFLEENDSVGVVSSLVRFGGDREQQQGYALHVDWINSLVTHEEMFRNRFVESPICNPSVMFRSELIPKHGGAHDGDFPEDYEMWLRWMEGGVVFGKVAEELHIWNDPPERITRNDERYSNDAFERAKLPYLASAIRKNAGERNICVCGAGRVTRMRSDLLIEAGIKISNYIDVDPFKIGKQYNGIHVFGVESITTPGEQFIISSIGNRGAREAIRRMLTERNFAEGRDFILAQ